MDTLNEKQPSNEYHNKNNMAKKDDLKQQILALTKEYYQEDRVSLIEALKALETHYGQTLVFTYDDVRNFQVKMTEWKPTIEEALDSLLADFPLTYIRKQNRNIRSFASKRNVINIFNNIFHNIIRKIPAKRLLHLCFSRVFNQIFIRIHTN